MITIGHFALLILVALYFTEALYKLGVRKPGWNVLVVFALLGVYFTENVLSHGPIDVEDVAMGVSYLAVAWNRFDLAKYRAQQGSGEPPLIRFKVTSYTRRADAPQKGLRG